MATYHEIIIKGDGAVVDAYLKGFLAGRGIKSGFYLSREWPFHRKSIYERFKYHGEVEHVICVGKLKQTIVGSINKSDVDIEVKETREIESICFRFDFKTANRDVGGTIKRSLRNLPDGVQIEDLDPVERVYPDGKGVEAYAPLHEYEFTGKGVARGDVEGVLKLHKRFRESNSFRTEEIEINACTD
jgi:hypothetical protein